jgi:hypothetical protein
MPDTPDGPTGQHTSEKINGEAALTLARQRFPELSGDGIRTYPGGAPQPVHADQTETAMAFLKLLRPTTRPTIDTGTLKHDAENWGSVSGLCAYVSRGALISAALMLGLKVCPHRCGGDAQIGVSIQDLKQITKKSVNTPPAKAGGFRLRLEAGLIDPSGRLVKPP